MDLQFISASLGKEESCLVNYISGGLSLIWLEDGLNYHQAHQGAILAYSTILRQEGVGDLWTGIGPNIARNAIINDAELASYDQVKQVSLPSALALQFMWLSHE
ncbi:hypothetical protein ABKV19_016958 [Rosa sericea]